jgi:leucyl/phenylalanyl-tRNA--protein transferase
VTQDITPQMLLNAYANGYFPMAEHAEDAELYWFNPRMRGVLPLALHVPRRLARFMRTHPFEITVNRAFPQVIAGCAERESTWINARIIALYCQLWQSGFAHSVECWRGGALVGGIYGVALGGAFFGESMFSRMPNASKVALVHLAGLLRTAGYTLFDTQYMNEHIRQFGVIEITQEEYMGKLSAALGVRAGAIG